MVKGWGVRRKNLGRTDGGGRVGVWDGFVEGAGFVQGNTRMDLSSFLFIYLLLSLLGGTVKANVMLIGRNFSMSFDDIEANFAPSIKGSGECGIFYLAEPLDACSPLVKAVRGKGAASPFALIVRGGCTFDDKVRNAQKAGFKAAIVFDNEDGGALVAMAGNPSGIRINAVFISKTSGEILKKYAGLIDMELWIIPAFENSAWAIMAISFISLLAMSAVLATCFFVRRHRIRRERPQAPNIREFHGMSSRLVKAMPSLIFTSVLEDNSTSRTCAICLEDYNVGEKLRVLPCRHKFHAVCVDSWLTTWRTFCPICKRDARTSIPIPPASECTPLLSPSSTCPSTALSSAHSLLTPTSSAIQIAPSYRSSTALSSAHSLLTPTSSAIQIAPSYRSSTALSSAHSSLATSAAIRISQASYRSPSASVGHSHSLSSTPYLQSLKTYGNSPSISVSRSSVDLRNAASSQRSYPCYLVSPQFASPLNSRYASSFIPSPGNGSPMYLGSSSQQPFLRHCSDSAASISPLASAQSLPGC